VHARRPTRLASGGAPAEQLETDHLVLRRYRVSDAAIVSEAIEQSRAALEAWAPNVAKRRTIAEVATGLAALEIDWTTSRKLVYGIYVRPGGGFVGEAGLYSIDWQRGVAEIGLWLRTGAEGHNYGREAYAAILALAFDELELTAVEALIHPPNERSRRLAERAGFHLANTIPGVQEHHGTTADILVYRLEA
jgi:ribosomal-protein-serine acetyltransferase